MVEAGLARPPLEGAEAGDIRHGRGYDYCQREQGRGCGRHRREKGQAAPSKVVEGASKGLWSPAVEYRH